MRWLLNDKFEITLISNSNLKTKKFFLISLIFTFCILPFIPFQTINGLDGLAVPSNTFILLPISLFTFIYFLAHRSEINVSTITSKLTIICLIMFFYITFKQGLTLNSAYTRISYILLLALVIQLLYWIKPNKHTITKIIIFSLLIQCLYGFIQISNLGLQNDFIFYFERPVGSFAQVNIMASTLAIGLIFALYQNLNHEHSKNTKILISSFIIISPSIITLCSSRTAYISLAICLTIFFVCNCREIFKNHLSLLIKLGSGFFLAILLFLIMENSYKDLESLKSPGIRLDMYLNSLIMFIEKPFLGWGFGSYIYSFYYSIYDNSLIYDFINPIDSLSTHPHNELALWGIEGGIIGIIFICTILYIFIKALIKFKCNSDTAFGSGLVVLLPLLLHIMLEHPMYTSSLYGLYFCLFFYIYTTPGNKKENTLHTRIIGVIFAVKSVLLVPIIIVILQSSLLSTAYLKTGNRAIRDMIISDFPSRLYLIQMDLLIKTHNARVNEDYISLEELNNQIFENLKTIPAKSLASDYLNNCNILSNCEKNNIKFINRYFNIL